MSYNDGIKDIIIYLKKLGIETISKNEKKELSKIIEGYSKEDIIVFKRELDMLFAINQSLVKTYGRVSVNNMLSFYKSTDADLLIKLYSIYEGIKEKSKDEIEAKRNFRKVVLDIMNANEVVNEIVAESLDETFRKSIELKDSLYFSMLDKEKADMLFENCKRRSKLFIRECETRNLENIIMCLKRDYNFSNDELVSISKRCASFFVFSSVSKINNLNRSIENFKAFIKSQEVKMNVSVEIDKLLSKDFKDVLKDSSSVATVNVDSFNKTLRFLMGENIGSLVKGETKFREMKGDFTPFQLAKIYNESITSLGISVEKINDVSNNIYDSYKRVYGKGLNINKLINGHNFTSISQLSKEDYDERKLDEIFGILSMFVSQNDMENLLRNDFSFLIASVEEVKNSLQEATLASSNVEELKKNVMKKIKNHFDIYEKQDTKVLRESKTSYNEALNKVKVKDIEEDEIKEALIRLDASEEDINAWIENWNKEEREAKEYNDLAIEIGLEDIYAQIESFKEFLRIQFINPEQFVSEVKVVKDLFIELEEKYNAVALNQELTGNAKRLSLNIEKELDNIMTSINNDFILVMDIYKTEMENLTLDLEAKKRALEKSNEEKEKRDELDRIIEERGISKEKAIGYRNIVLDVEKLVEELNSSIANIQKKEREASNLIASYFEFLREEAKRDILTQGLNGNFKNGESKMLSRYYPMFIYALEVEDLIGNADELLGNKYNVPKLSYKEYRRMLNSDEARITDSVYRMYRENMEEKKVMRNRIDEYIEKYDISSNGLLSSEDKIQALFDYVQSINDEVEYEEKISFQSAKLDRKKINETIQTIEEEKEKMEREVEEYIKKIEALRKEKISR